MKRNLHRVVYTSSYDRGLQHLLEMWPQVRAAVPDAELHIYYGMQLFDKMYHDNPSSMKWKNRMVELMGQDGVADHGRLPQPLLQKELEQSGIFAYPTHFGEINCISAIKAQAFGCEPVVVNYAALKETVQYGRKVEGDIYDQETKDEFLKQLIDSLTHPMSKDDRDKMMSWARNTYSWNKIATDWSQLFQEVT